MGDTHALDFGRRASRRPRKVADAVRAAVKAPEDLFERWYYRYDRRIDERRARVARTDPVGALLQDKLDEVGGLGWEEWETYNGLVTPVVPDGWPVTVHYWLQSHGPTRQYKKVEAVAQRARWGFAEQDVWDLHYYLSKVIAGSVRRLAELTIAYPGEGTLWPTPEAWAAALDELAGRFERLCAYDTDERDRIAEADEAFALLRDMWFQLWD